MSTNAIYTQSNRKYKHITTGIQRKTLENMNKRLTNWARRPKNTKKLATFNTGFVHFYTLPRLISGHHASFVMSLQFCEGVGVVGGAWAAGGSSTWPPTRTHLQTTWRSTKSLVRRKLRSRNTNFTGLNYYNLYYWGILWCKFLW